MCADVGQVNDTLEGCGEALNLTLREKTKEESSSSSLLPVSTIVQYRLPPGGSRPSSAPSNSATLQSEDKSTGLSVAAAVGIAIGVFAFLCLIAGAFLLIIRRRRRAAKYGIVAEGTIQAPPGVGTYAPPTVQEMSGEGDDAKPVFRHLAAEVDSTDSGKHEMPPNHLTEMRERKRAELLTNERKRELAATQDVTRFEMDASGDASKTLEKR